MLNKIFQNGECSCDPHSDFGDRCVTCNGVGEFDEKTGTCKCAENAFLSWDDKDGWTCTCGNDFYQFPDEEPEECIKCFGPGASFDWVSFSSDKFFFLRTNF